MTHFIYTLTHPKTNQVVYVGRTYQPDVRFATHKTNFKKQHKFVPIPAIVETHYDFSYAHEREWELTQYYNKISPLMQSCDRKRIGAHPKSTVDYVNVQKTKSEPLTDTEKRALRTYVKQFHTKVDCAEAIGICRNVLDRILIYASGAPDTVQKVRQAINNNTKY